MKRAALIGVGFVIATAGVMIGTIIVGLPYTGLATCLAMGFIVGFKNDEWIGE